MVYINKIIESILPLHLKKNPILYRKAKILTYIHVFCIIVGLFLFVFSSIIAPDNPVPILPGVILVIILTYLWYRRGNLILSGNLLAAAFAAPLAPFVPETGGIHSDNLLWLIISPIIALLFANKRSGYLWISALLIYTCLLFLYHDKIPINLTVNGADYYFISYFFLFLAIFGTVIIFETGQALIIKMLNNQKALLEEQKALLEEQKELLEQQKAEISQKNEELEEIQITLRKSNSELENFAFVASHDLKEPLRMIRMYSGFTQKRLLGHTDKSVHEFMGYVNDGAERMEALLNDLLQYSRLGKKKEDVKDIDLNNTLFVVINNMLATMKDTDASIMANKLPVIEANHTEMVQLFQNLIANSIKFRRTGVLPEIKILAQDNGEQFLISFTDNGIGIKEEFRERVFGIFEKLHKHTEYEGTGIGLATCKKIVGSVGGDIWLESTEGVGTTFFFTLPKPSLN